MTGPAVQGTSLTAGEATVQDRARRALGVENLWPVRVIDERGPARLSSRIRLSPRLFRRLTDSLRPVVEARPDLREVPPRTVLMIRTDEVGDLMMTLPLLTAMRVAWPQARVTLVTRGLRGEVMRGGSMVDDVVTWPAKPWRESLAGQLRCWRFARRLLRRSRPAQGRYDLAVLPRRDAEHFGSRYVAAAAADRVIAFDPADRLGPIGPIDQESERDLVSDLVCAGEPLTHVLRQGERLAAALGVTITPDAYDAPGLALIGPADHAAARTLLSPLNALATLNPLTSVPAPLVAVMLNSPHARGAWPGYAEAVNQVHQRLGIRVVLLGGPDDELLADDFVRTLNPSVPIVSAVGRAPLRTTLALLATSDLYLGGVCDAMHLACAVATPCVAVTCHPAGGNPADDDAPNRIGPWSADSRVVGPARPASGCQDTCVSDVAHCITGVGTALVARTVTDVLLGTASRAVVPSAAQVPQQTRHAEQAGFATA
ncbi:glycosyltransferase family 9 protein [Kineosporia sp. NBRC 101731]|uniref:glycosyltransferase family 9 protein n=1 Tax=Kineosporia sp. NBRC 101731 TaxID=3032199 RepID=UPI0024A27546|nr:glycosyltransferase family 9 protein [Kineosporia sp. NBRC 101731]GLY33133.1 hypothetical protein Kisp02_64980 [Kineosporia sp. NBRC 101731]